MPTALQGFRENNRERRGVGPPCQHSRAFSASGKGLKRWPLILSPTLRSALLRASRRTATSETEPAAILRDGASRLLRMRSVGLSSIHLIRLVSWNRSTRTRTHLPAVDAYADRHEALSHRDAMLVVLGVLLPTFMGSLDQTILANALPTIGRDFNDVHNLPWLITAYLLASTAVMPLYGKIADIHGRRFTLRIAITTYIAGSLVCALAPDMLVLIFGRVLHGLGGGGLSSMGMIVLGDLVAPKERGRYYTYFSIIYTTAGGSGPLLGGFIADHLHWSVIFWINIPMGLAALAIPPTLLPRPPRRERPHRLDLIG